MLVPSIMTNITVLRHWRAEFKVAQTSSFPHNISTVGRTQQINQFQQHCIPTFSYTISSMNQRLAVVACWVFVYIQQFVVFPLQVASWWSMVSITQGLHLRFILTCDMFLTSFPSRKEKRYCLCHFGALQTVILLDAASDFQKFSLHLLTTYQKFGGYNCLFLVVLLVKPNRRAKLSSHHFKNPTLLFDLKYNNCKWHSNPCIL